LSSDLLSLPFDQYQRYRLVADLLEEVRPRGQIFDVLDVGGRTALLRAFLPQDRVHLVDVEPSSERGLVLGDGSALPFRDRSFDVVCAFDTLEHVPPDRRAAFVSECTRVARRYVLIAGPYQAPEVEEAERILQRFLVDKLGVEHRYLEEHRHNGLPSREATSAGLAVRGARVASIGHANLERWLALMCVSMYLDYEPALRPLAARIFRFYNAGLFASDHAAPVYRHAVVAAFDGAPMPSGRALTQPPEAPAGLLARFQDVLDELVAFDRERGEWNAERRRLAQTIATLEVDLEGHRGALATESKLRIEATTVLGETANQLEQLRAIEADLAQDLAGHRAALAETRADLEGHRGTVATLRGELIAARQAHAESTDQLRVTSQALEAARQELQVAAAQLREQDQKIGELRALVVNRWKSLKRALGPKRPPP
jgi:hypothetical protein